MLEVLLVAVPPERGAARHLRLFTILAAESVDDDHPAHDWFLALYSERRAVLVGTAWPTRSARAVDADLDPGRCSQILAMFDGLQLQWLLDPAAVDMTAVFEDFLTRLRPR